MVDFRTRHIALSGIAVTTAIQFLSPLCGVPANQINLTPENIILSLFALADWMNARVQERKQYILARNAQDNSHEFNMASLEKQNPQPQEQETNNEKPSIAISHSAYGVEFTDSEYNNIKNAPDPEHIEGYSNLSLEKQGPAVLLWGKLHGFKPMTPAS